MPVIINGSGSVTGLSVGGLPDGTVDADTLASNAVTAAKLASGVGGKILQVVSTTKGDTTSQTSLGQGEYWDLSSIFKVDITPASASNKILISGHVNFQHDGSEVFALALYRDGSLYTAANGNQTDIGNRMRAMSGGFSERSWDIVTCPINFLDTALGNTNQKSYSVGLTSSTGSDRTYYLNRPYTWTNSNQYFNWSSTITAMEVAA